MPEILYKHHLSSASDSYVSYDIDDDKHIVKVRMSAIDGREFMSFKHLEDFVFECLLDHGINIIRDENFKSIDFPQTNWKVFVNVGETKLEVLAWNLLATDMPERCIELFPA